MVLIQKKKARRTSHALTERGILAEGECLPASVEAGGHSPLTDSGETRFARIPESTSIPASVPRRPAVSSR